MTLASPGKGCAPAREARRWIALLYPKQHEGTGAGIPSPKSNASPYSKFFFFHISLPLMPVLG